MDFRARSECQAAAPTAWTKARQRVAAKYDQLLQGLGEIRTPQVGADREHVYHLYVIRTDQRDALRKHLTAAGISTVLNYPRALPFYPAYAYLGQLRRFPRRLRKPITHSLPPIYPENARPGYRICPIRLEASFKNPKTSSAPQCNEQVRCRKSDGGRPKRSYRSQLPALYI